MKMDLQMGATFGNSRGFNNNQI